MEEEIWSILRCFGWSEGFRIPVANEENRILESKVEEALKKKHQVESQLHDTNNNLISIKQYRDSIVEQRRQNEQMLVDYRKQVEEEERSLQELRAQKESLVRDTKLLKKRKNELGAENERLRIEYEAAVKQCEDIRKDIDWSAEVEEFLDENIDQGNAVIKMMEKFNVQDRAKFEQTEVKRVRLINELNECKNLLHQTDTETAGLNCELEKLTKQSEDLRDQRQWLIRQWESSVGTLRTRDAEIEKLVREINILTEVSRKVESETMEYEGFYKEQIRNNMQVEIEIRRVARDISNQQLFNEKLNRDVERKSEEVLLVSRTELTALGAAVSEQRSKNTQLKREIMARNELVEKLKVDYENLREKWKDLEGRSCSAVERKKQLEIIFQNEERRSHAVLLDRQRLDRSMQKIKCEIADVEDKYVLASSETKQLLNVKSKLLKSLEDLKAEISSYEETLTTTELETDAVSSMIRRFKEEKSDELREQLEAEVARLSAELEEKNKTMSSIRAEVNKCLTQINILTRETQAYADKVSGLKEEKENLRMEVETSEKRLSKIVEENKEKEMTENMLRLRADQLERALTKTGGVVLSMEKQQVELETLMRERLLEIETSFKTLKIRKKVLLAEISVLRRNIDQINANTAQFMNKYEIIMDSVGKDEKGEPVTISNFRVKLVRERFDLLEKGDDLDEKIRKVEKEIQALENTLTLMNVCSKKYKESTSPIDKNSKKYQEKEEVEHEYNRLLSTLKKHKRTFPELANSVEELKTKLSEFDVQAQHLQRDNRDKISELSQLEREVNEQYVKLKRVDDRMKSVKKSLKTLDGLQLIERDFLTKELRSVNRMALSYIADMVMAYPETETNATSYLSKKGITLPCRGSTKKMTRNVTPSSDISSQTSATKEDSLASVSEDESFAKLTKERKFVNFKDASSIFR